MGNVGSVQCQIVPCSGLYLFLSSIGVPQMHSLSINCWILICCACHFQSGSPFFIYFGFLCLQVSSISNLCPDTRMKVATYLGSLVQLYCGERDTANKYCVLSCVGSALSGWTTLGLPQHKPACTSQVSTA